MRVTQGMMSSQLLYNLSNNNQMVMKLQNEAATGLRINSPSDDPIGVGYVLQYTDEQASDNQYMNNAQTAQGVLNSTDSIMSEATNVMQSARDLAVEGANGTLTASDRQDLSAQAAQLYQQMVTIGNSQYNNQYIFNGQNTNQAPYSAASAQTDPTDNGQVLYDLGDGVNLPVNVPGNQFFGAPGATVNAFALLNQLQTNLTNNDTTALSSSLNQFDSSLTTMSAAQSQVGSLTDRAQLMQNRMSDMSQSVQGLLANTQDADLATVITSLTSAQATQSASLQIGAQALQPSLVDFLK